MFYFSLSHKNRRKFKWKIQNSDFHDLYELRAFKNHLQHHLHIFWIFSFSLKNNKIDPKITKHLTREEKKTFFALDPGSPYSERISRSIFDFHMLRFPHRVRVRWKKVKLWFWTPRKLAKINSKPWFVWIYQYKTFRSLKIEWFIVLKFFVFFWLFNVSMSIHSDRFCTQKINYHSFICDFWQRN